MSDEDNNIVKLLKALLSPRQSLEEALQQLKSERFIDAAIGEQLDVIGRVTGQPRNGLDDDTYRRYIRARISAHNSDGTVEDFITVADLVIYDDNAQYVVSQEGTATVRVRVNGITVDDDIGAILFDFIYTAKSGGVRVVVQWAGSLPASVFRYDSGPGYDQGHLATSLS